MRLIDADKLMLSLADWKLQEAPTHAYEKPKEFTADDMQRMIWRTIRDCESAVEEQPTVDAIPIELYEQVKGERDVAIEQLKSLNIELFEKPYLKAIPIEWIKKHNYSNLIDLWEKECRLKTTKDVLNELLSEHNFKSYNDYVEYAGKITALPRDDRLDILFKERENETN